MTETAAIERKTIRMPEGVDEIISRLNRNGYEAYAVGGCVRDSLLGETPKDWDITTSAEPDQVMRIFRGNRSIPTGLQHGTVTVLSKGGAYEVTTYRIDGGYSDGRRPDNVSFTGSLREDLNRRDFTINAMAYNHKEGLIDCFNGVTDLKNKTVRCVGEAEARFSEDYLRMLRAYRFAAVLGFEMEESLQRACLKNKQKLLNVSAERVRAELDKIILSDHFPMIKKFLDDFSEVLLPEIFALKGVAQNNRYHYLDVYDHTFSVLKHTPKDIQLRLTALLHDIGKAKTKRVDAEGISHFSGHQKISAEMALDVLKRLKYDNQTINRVVTLIRIHDQRIPPEKTHVRRLISQLGESAARQSLLFQYADAMGQSDAAQQENLPKLTACFQLYDEIIADGDPCTVKALAVNGKDVTVILNLPPGEKVGEVLNGLLDAVLDNPVLNDRGQLIALMLSKYHLNNGI